MTVPIGSGNVAKIRLAEQGSDPATPPSGFAYAYVKNDGGLYLKNDAGTVVGPLNTAPDLVTGTSTALDGLSALVVGSMFSLSVTGTVGYINPLDMGARVYNDANVVVTGSAIIALPFNSERWDTNNFHSTSIQTTRLTIPIAGKYWISGHVEFAGNAVGVRQAIIYVNGVTTPIAVSRVTPANTGASHISVSTEYIFNVGDFVQLAVFQDSGGNLNVNSAANYSPEFVIRRVS